MGDRSEQQDQVALLSHPRAPGCVMVVLADGMGGRRGGRLAADQVMLTARQLFEGYAPATDSAATLLQQLVTQAHTMIRLMALASEQEPHSTVAAFILNPAGDCHWVHAGDSRIYHFRNGALLHRTRDHSHVQSLLDRGELDAGDAASHPKAHVLTHCLGTTEPPPKSAHSIAQVQPGDVLLACSDGIWSHFSHEALGRLLSQLDAAAAGAALVEQARARAHGCSDNLSLAIVKIEASANTG